MKKLMVLAALALLVLSIPAEASWNVRQRGDGSAVWTDQNSVDVPIGNPGLVMHLTNLAAAQTYFVVTNKPGKIKRVYAVNNGMFSTSSTAPVLSFSIGTGATIMTRISTGASLHVPTSTVGIPSIMIPSDSGVDVKQGYVIGIANNGGSTGGNGATITIVIE